MDKEELMNEAEKKLIEIDNLYNSKKDLMAENFRQAEEIQNLKFMLNDR